MKKLTLLTAIFFAISKITCAQLDNSFGNKGIVKADLGAAYNYNNTGKQVLLQPDGGMYILFETNGLALVAKKLADGSPDLTYGNNGLSVPMALGKSVPANPHAALQNDGKIVVASSGRLARLNADGSLDETFAGGGIQFTPVYNSYYDIALAIQPDGKIIVGGGSVRFVVARYNTNGSPDNTFGQSGTVETDIVIGGDEAVNAVALQSDGKIVAAGFVDPDYHDLAIVRYNTDGSLDDTFSGDGIQITDSAYPNERAMSVIIQNDNKILVGAITDDGFSHILLARYDTDGNLDSSFDADGIQTADFNGSQYNSTSIAIQSDGKIVAAANTLNGNNNDFAIARFNPDGSPDNTFNGDGKLTIDFGSADDYTNSIAIQSDGKLVVVGHTISGGNTYIAAARYNPDGTADNSFAGDGKLIDNIRQGNTYYTAIAVQNDGKILAAGRTFNGSNWDFVLVRYNNDGSFDNSFSGDGKQMTDFSSSDDRANALALQKDGKIIVAGSAGDNFALARYNSDGSPDNTFDGDGLQTSDIGAGDYIISIAIQSDGKIVAAGSTLQGRDRAVLLRYQANGTLDNSFNGTGKLLPSLFFKGEGLAIQSDGKIIIMGFGWDDDFIVERYNPDGSHDTGFGENGTAILAYESERYFHGRSIAIQADGKIIIGGYEVMYDDFLRFAAARLTPEGHLDNSFSADGWSFTVLTYFEEDVATSLAIQDNGQIILAGYIYNGNEYDFAIIRYNVNGSLDSSFGNLGKQITNASQGSDRIAGINISENKLYAAGYGQFPGNMGVVAKYLLGSIAETPPTVELTAPLDNALYLKGGNVYLTATAADADGRINKVEFYSGTTLLYTDTAAPYTFKWEHVRTGNYTLTARATDNSGLSTVSAAVPISVVPNKAPSVSIINPANNKSFLKGGTIHLQAVAKDPDGRITKVEFYNGTTLLATERKLPYTYDWKKAPVGNYIITARASDNWGAVTISPAVNVSVVSNHAPTINIINPANGERFTSPAIITLEAAAQDADGRITKVEFYNGTALLALERKPPYAIDWRNVPEGSYSITARATDNWGAVTVSAPVQVFVVRAPKCAPGSQPVFGFDFNGAAVVNINNGSADSSESAGVEVCDGGQYTTSGHFNSSSSNLYNITDVSEGGTLLFEGGQPDISRVITAAELSASAGLHSIMLADPNVGGTLTQTITPFTDVNKNKILDAGDCAGDPIVFKYTAIPCPCSVASKPTFGFNFNGIAVANINNGTFDPSESANITVCDGGQYATSGHFNSNSRTLYNITDITGGSTLLFNGSPDYNRVITAAELSATAGTYAITLKNPDVAGTLIQTITPFTDFNNNGTLDAGDCAGDPIVFTYVALPCTAGSSFSKGGKLSSGDPTGFTGIKIWPNPANGVVNIFTAGLNQNKQTTLSVISATGALLKTKRFGNLPQTIQLDVSSLAGGLYVIKLINGDKVMYKQFVKL